jgi:hypothetical protein
MIIFYIAHPSSKLKAKFDVHNIKLLSKYNKVYIITTKGLEYNSYLNLSISGYYEIENNNLLDFGKYYFAAKEILPTLNINNNEHITFINDSIILKSRLKRYFNMINDKLHSNIEMFAMIDSYEHKYHYQSYLFSIRYNSVYKFINFIENYINTYGTLNNSKDHIIQNLELNLIYQFNFIKSFFSVKEGTHNIFNSRKLIRKYLKKKLDIIKFTNIIKNHDNVNINENDIINKKLIKFIFTSFKLN